MSVRPTAAELVEAVRDFLERQALPALEGRNAFHARVAINALDIVHRELGLGVAADVGEQERLVALLGGDAVGSLEELSRELCRRIRSGSLTLESPGLREHLWATTLARLAIDQPKYRSVAAAAEKMDRD